MSVFYRNIAFQSPLHAKVYNLVTDDRFDWAAYIISTLNCLLFTCYHYNASADFVRIIRILDYIFILLLAVEVGLRLFGLRRAFKKNPFNSFDAFILGYCLAGKN